METNRFSGRTAAEIGNALFLILIAVALFAALAYAVTQSSRGGSGGTSREKAALDAAQIAQYSTSVQQAVSRLLLAGGCSETQISAQVTGGDGYTNASAPVDESCHIFKPAGGGLTRLTAPAGTNDGSPYWITGSLVAHMTGENPAFVAANAELAIFLPAVTEAVCAALNAGLDISGIPVDFGDVDQGAGDRFQGTYLAGDNVSGSPSGKTCSDPTIETPNLCGRNAGRFEEQASGRYIYYHVLHYRP